MSEKEGAKKEFEEIFGAQNAMLFMEEPMMPIFCKPKLLPLKTFTMEKMEKMQKEAIEKLKALEEPEETEDPNCPEIIAGAETEEEKVEKKADIWSADD